eukprot:CAMPEP_0117664732 /NCGR_PEP_ID=MMETSP0804-20121206/9393_1 /TAXON_ID=1074897 /ORGANISM="Tetraselmis astigmatica, Strain CCMP880" /LENGTH=312 /DNA_ID=CAMNT_0005472017 /DNA_START=237 /DNA_END=1175 /DNA_ORIENTATION=-
MRSVAANSSSAVATVSADWRDGALACWNQDAFQVYQCPSGTACCGKGSVDSPSQQWDKCCMAASRSEVTLELWPTLTVCMIVLVMAAGALVLFAEIWRRRAQEKVNRPSDEASGTSYENGSDVVIDMQEIPKPLGILVRKAASPSPAKQTNGTEQPPACGSTPKMAWLMRKLSFGSRSPRDSPSKANISNKDLPAAVVSSLRSQYSRTMAAAAAAYPDSPGTVSSSSGSESFTEAPTCLRDAASNLRTACGSSSRSGAASLSAAQALAPLSRFRKEKKRVPMSEVTLNQPVGTSALPPVTCEGTGPSIGKEN